MTGARLAARAERQRRVLDRTDSPPSVWVVADELALYRQVGTPAVMAGQMRRLAEIAAMPLVTLTVMPAIAHAANASGFVLADDAAWCEHRQPSSTSAQRPPGRRKPPSAVVYVYVYPP